MKTLPFPPFYPKATPAAAGVFASLDGMIEVFKLSFGYRPDLVSEKTLNLMQTLSFPIEISITGEALTGRAIRTNREFLCPRVAYSKDKNQPGKEMIFHGGSIAGISTFIGLCPCGRNRCDYIVDQGSRVAPGAGITFWYDVIS